jgi:hypothetical protein
MSKSSWLSRNKSIVAAAYGTQDCGRFLYSVHYDVLKSEASCTLNGKFGNDAFANEQLVSLVLRPEQILACDFRQDMEGSNIASQMLVMMPTTSFLKVLRLTLRLISNGAVQCPAATLLLPFTDPLASDFVAFPNLCQTTAVNVYIGETQFSVKQLQGLEDFTDRLSPRPLCLNAINLRRLRGG